jgi:hypothetical protein
VQRLLVRRPRPTNASTCLTAAPTPIDHRHAEFVEEPIGEIRRTIAAEKHRLGAAFDKYARHLPAQRGGRIYRGLFERHSMSRQPVANHEGQFAPSRDFDRLVNVPPAAGEQLLEKRAINTEHHGRRAHRPARASSNCLNGCRIMPFGE